MNVNKYSLTSLTSENGTKNNKFKSSLIQSNLTIHSYERAAFYHNISTHLCTLAYKYVRTA